MIFIQAIRLANINIKTIKRVISYLEELALNRLKNLAIGLLNVFRFPNLDPNVT